MNAEKNKDIIIQFIMKLGGHPIISLNNDNSKCLYDVGDGKKHLLIVDNEHIMYALI